MSPNPRVFYGAIDYISTIGYRVGKYIGQEGNVKPHVTQFSHPVRGPTRAPGGVETTKTGGKYPRNCNLGV